LVVGEGGVRARRARRVGPMITADFPDTMASLIALAKERSSYIVTAALADVEATDDAYFASLGDRRPAFVDALRALDTARIGEDAAAADSS
jgi:hypothetical protein